MLENVQENELIIFLLGAAVLIFLIVNRQSVINIPEHKILTTSFYVLSFAWAATIVEGFFLGDLLNLFEHLSYAASSVLLTVWCWKVFYKGETGQS